jgi:hypothetical protein
VKSYIGPDNVEVGDVNELLEIQERERERRRAFNGRLNIYNFNCIKFIK